MIDATLIWLLELAGFFVLILILNFFLPRLLARMKREEELPDWRLFLDGAILTPVRVLLWILFVAFLIDTSIRQFGLAERISSIAPLRNVLVILCVAWFLLRWKKVFHQAIATQRVRGKFALEVGSIQIVTKIFTIAVLFITLLLVLQVIGLNIVPLLAFGGIGAAALGFASKDVVANFYGGLMVHLTRPFTVNDLIELPQKKIMGSVEEVGWYFTAIRDPQKKPIYVPNALFSTEILINQSRMTHRRMEEKIFLRLSDADKTGTLIEQIHEYLSRHAEIDPSLPIGIFLAAFTSSSLEIEIKAYTLSTRYEEFMAIKQEILLKIYELVEGLGAAISIPSMEVILPKKPF